MDKQKHTDERRLDDAPIGLFWYKDTLALKTEYRSNEGRIDAYIVSSGEFFWGEQPQTIESQNNCMVRPVLDAESRLNATERLSAGFAADSAGMIEGAASKIGSPMTDEMLRRANALMAYADTREGK